jgi:hypothetical protein
VSFIKKTAEFWSLLSGRVTIRLESTPIDSVALLTEFATTKAAFVAQKTLYGYLKTRMGTRYPTMFEDMVFVDSINIAKLHAYAGCLSDLSVYVVAYALQHLPKDDPLRNSIARQIFETGLANNKEQVSSIEEFSAAEALVEFDLRLRDTTWTDASAGRANFKHSAKTIITWAPIAPELKQYDAGVVRNSVMFAWHGIREQFKKRVDIDKISSEATSQLST